MKPSFILAYLGILGIVLSCADGAPKRGSRKRRAEQSESLERPSHAASSASGPADPNPMGERRRCGNRQRQIQDALGNPEHVINVRDLPLIREPKMQWARALWRRLNFRGWPLRP